MAGSRYKKNVILASIFTLLTLLSNFILYRVSNNYLYSDESYGLWLIILSIVTWFYIMDFGISNSLRNYLTSAIEKKNVKSINEIITTTYLIMLIPLLLLLLFGIISNEFLDWGKIFNVKYNKDEANRLFLISFIMFPFVFYLNTITYIYHSYFKSYVVNIMQFLNLFINCIIIKIFDLLNFGNLTTLAITYFLTNITIYLLFTIYFFSKEKRQVKLRIKFFSSKWVQPLLSLGIGFFVLDIASLALLNSGPFLISYFFNPVYSVKFQLPYKLLSIFLTLSTIVLSPLWTLIISKLVEKKFKDIRRINFKIIILQIIIGITILVSTFVLNYIIYIWVGKNYHIQYSFLILVSTIVIFSIVSHVYKTLLNAMSIVFSQVYVYTIGVVVCFTLMYILVDKLNHGPYYFLFSINIGLLIPAISLPFIFYRNLKKLEEGD